MSLSNRNLQMSELPLALCLKAGALPIVIVFGVSDRKYGFEEACDYLL
jgi:hypothetical protein